ncbi:hypothetical protein HYV11_03290, partial [Candidatus Dependentiae bacterium]|nr:hypothetical protein [Candidatus Dependentiae bacterium]
MKNIFFKKAIFLLPILFLKLQSGFVGETLVKTPQGYQEIRQLKIGDEVYGINKKGDVTTTEITHAIAYKSKKYLQINFDNQEIIVQQSQKFLLPLKHVWRKTKKLHEKDEVLDAWYRSIKVTVAHQDKNEKTFYDIRLKKDHAFLVTDNDIIVHNCPLFMIGIAISWAGCCFTVETIWVGCCVAGLWLGSKLIPKSRRIEPFAK